MGKDKPRELTSGKQGATHSPVLSHDGTKAAWTELDEDGYESDRYFYNKEDKITLNDNCTRAKIVIYDLTKDVRYTLTQKWDRSPDALAVSVNL